MHDMTAARLIPQKLGCRGEVMSKKKETKKEAEGGYFVGRKHRDVRCNLTKIPAGRLGTSRSVSIRFDMNRTRQQRQADPS